MQKFFSKIFIDGGIPDETRKAKELLGYLDGQTTNPTLIARNLKEQGTRNKEKITEEKALEEYKKIVQEMSRIIPQGSISIQVFANQVTKAEEMLSQARERSQWIPNCSIKFPCTHEGLKAAHSACREMPINITLVFSQSQAAAVYEATKCAKYPVFISPFVGRLDDRGELGMDVIVNILKMYPKEDPLSPDVRRNSVRRSSHVEVLTASVRNLDHLKYALQLKSNIITIPFKVFSEWAELGFAQPDSQYKYPIGNLKPISYRPDISLGKSWESYDLSHDLTDKGVSAFWNDWMGMFG